MKGTVQSTSQGLWRFGADYLLAVRCVDVNIATNSRLYFPTYYLYGLAIELSLKAFLLKRGESSSAVQSYGHDLHKVLAAARKRKLGRVVTLDSREIDAIQLLNTPYARHHLRYITIEFSQLPAILYLSRAAEELVVGLEEFCTGNKGKLTHAV